MPKQKDVFDKLIASFDRLTKQEMQIADYILSHKMTVPYITISELASECGVGTATVTRFAQKLNFESFREFKLETLHALHIQDSTGFNIMGSDVYEDVEPTDSITEKSRKLCNAEIRALMKTMESIEPQCIANAVELLRKANAVFCFGQGNSSIIAMEAWGSFSSITKKFQHVANGHMQAAIASLLGPDDVILYFSFSGSTRELMDFKDIPKKTGAKLILVTRFPDAPGAESADVVIVCGADESPYQQGSVAIKIAQLFIIDILYNEYYYAEQELSQTNKRKTLTSTIPLHY